VNGELAADDPAVVALTVQGQVYCSAALITPSVVLTAAHCLPPHIGFGASDISVLFGTGIEVDRLVPAHDAWSNPGWHDQNFADDVGLLQMKGVAEVEPIPYNTVEVPDGTIVRMVGFGITGNGKTDSGVKRTGTGRILYQDDFVYEIDSEPAITCSGDSGGPTLVSDGSTERVAGIHSRSDCAFSAADTRVDAYVSDIQSFLQSHPDPSCELDGLCAAPCDGADPDCPCADDGECTSACPDPEQDPDCMNACGPDGVCEESCGLPDPDCPSCGPDGHCVAECPADPDCGEACDPMTECCDDDCEEPSEEPPAVEQGCAVHGSSTGDRNLGAWIALAGAWFLARRRRRER
jgi:hypothetical protein